MPIPNLLDSSELELHDLEIVDKLRFKLLDSYLEGFFGIRFTDLTFQGQILLNVVNINEKLCPARTIFIVCNKSDLKECIDQRAILSFSTQVLGVNPFCLINVLPFWQVEVENLLVNETSSQNVIRYQECCLIFD